MNVVIDDHHLRRVLRNGEPDWMFAITGADDSIYTTPRFKRRLESALQNPQGGTLSRGLSKADREIILSRLRQTPITVHVEPRTQHAHELNVLQPLWQEAIIGSVLLSATLVVRSIAITDRNRLAIERACELHGVPLLVRSVEGA